ncbi:2-hydroxychromene-2-carboxylate isomerase [Xanthobacter dioxanivorans]|uniref:2-hydroxychromene-2-carboxylate isomerase n=1 Tax=Xanthobacter dioxanivorans TaxID=2528964 RepID=A0A974PR52_9HYPH|nr:2-hydroxychromene-2-carboxylate isomerase [Xanthobacter dioxanivorans]QRG07655.1 2-hydroxychromene-2-carboxylate isomerase [Xanthobacter dioxanivorans]
MASAPLDFYYDFSSPYSYLAAARIAALAEGADVRIAWKPFLLGPIFAAKGHATSPLVSDPDKNVHMWADVTRLAELYHLPPLRRPDPFPVNSLLAARVALHLNDACRPAFTRAVYRAEFAEGRDIADRETIYHLLAGLGHFFEEVIDEAERQENKDRLRAQTEAARAEGVFGAPTFIAADGALFWGNDRLEMALDHARRLARAA